MARPAHSSHSKCGLVLMGSQMVGNFIEKANTVIFENVTHLWSIHEPKFMWNLSLMNSEFSLKKFLLKFLWRIIVCIFFLPVCFFTHKSKRYFLFYFVNFFKYMMRLGSSGVPKLENAPRKISVSLIVHSPHTYSSII